MKDLFISANEVMDGAMEYILDTHIISKKDGRGYCVCFYSYNGSVYKVFLPDTEMTVMDFFRSAKRC